MRMRIEFIFSVALLSVLGSAVRVLKTAEETTVSSEQNTGRERPLYTAGSAVRVHKSAEETTVSSEQNTSTGVGQCIFTDDFRGKMYHWMWQFMNMRMMQTIMSNSTLRLTTTPGIEDFDGWNGTGWPKEYYRTICFKGDEDHGGHYVYVDNTGDAQGSYEKGLLIREEDDGICHGAALCFWLFHEHNVQNYKLVVNPQNHSYDPRRRDPVDRLEAFKHNYRTLLQLYIDIIESGQWDNGLWQTWHTDVNSPITPRDNVDVYGRAVQGAWTFQETVQSLALLKAYITRFDPLPARNCKAPPHFR